MKGKNVGRTHNRHRRGLNRRYQGVTRTVVVSKGIDGGGGERDGEEKEDASSLLLAVVCDSLLPLSEMMEMMTSKGSLDVIKNCTCFPKGWLRVSNR